MEARIRNSDSFVVIVLIVMFSATYVSFGLTVQVTGPTDRIQRSC